MFARTERLLLRPAWREDAQALQQAIGDESIVRNLATVPWPYRLEDAESWCARDSDPAAPSFLIFSRTRGSPRLIGGIGIERAELGYWIARPCWGLGFATEAGRAVIDLAYRGLKLSRLTASHALDNPASGHVLRKLGFRATGEVIRRHSIGRGEMLECAAYARTADDAVPDEDIAALAA